MTENTRRAKRIELPEGHWREAEDKVEAYFDRAQPGAMAEVYWEDEINWVYQVTDVEEKRHGKR